MDGYDGTCQLLQGLSFLPHSCMYSGPFLCSQVREAGPGKRVHDRASRARLQGHATHLYWRKPLAGGGCDR